MVQSVQVVLRLRTTDVTDAVTSFEKALNPPCFLVRIRSNMVEAS